MFSGLVETTGEVTAVDNVGDAVRISISGRHTLTDARLGDSIAVNGVCLTVSELDAASGVFGADVMQESLNRSSLGDLRPGSVVNLERALRADRRYGYFSFVYLFRALGRITVPATRAPGEIRRGKRLDRRQRGFFDGVCYF